MIIAWATCGLYSGKKFCYRLPAGLTGRARDKSCMRVRTKGEQKETPPKKELDQKLIELEKAINQALEVAG